MATINAGLTRAASIVAVCSLSVVTTDVFAQGDPRVGTWELNLEKSSFAPGPPPRQQTLWYKTVPDGLTALLQGLDADGKPISPDAANFVINLDGRDHPTPRVGYDSSVWTRISANHYVVNRKRAGTIVQTSTNIVSTDGKTLTITTKGTGEDGRPFSNVRVYDKR